MNNFFQRIVWWNSNLFSAIVGALIIIGITLFVFYRTRKENRGKRERQEYNLLSCICNEMEINLDRVKGIMNDLKNGEYNNGCLIRLTMNNTFPELVKTFPNNLILETVLKFYYLVDLIDIHQRNGINSAESNQGILDSKNSKIIPCNNILGYIKARAFAGNKYIEMNGYYNEVHCFLSKLEHPYK